jgi:sortase A
MLKVLKAILILCFCGGLFIIIFVSYDEYNTYINKKNELVKIDKILEESSPSISNEGIIKEEVKPLEEKNLNSPTIEKIEKIEPKNNQNLNSDQSYIGVVSIPRFGIRGVIKEGVDLGTLKYSIGHYPETGLPGENRQIFLAGHNDREFRILNKINKGDLINVKTKKNSFNYEVSHSKIVSKNEISVVNSEQMDKDELVLMTCYPINYYFSDSPERLLIYAYRK